MGAGGSSRKQRVYVEMRERIKKRFSLFFLTLLGFMRYENQSDGVHVISSYF
jgi:hypothetical protein